jgi:putative Holliday junction resolvase
MSRIMAIDYGDVRTGIALSDLTGTLTGQTGVLTLTGKKLIASVAETARLHGVETVVVGCPRNMDGSYGPRAQACTDFAELLEARGLTVVLRDERLTTVRAHGILREHGKDARKRKQNVDAVAASLILQEYLDYRAAQG